MMLRQPVSAASPARAFLAVALIGVLLFANPGCSKQTAAPVTAYLLPHGSNVEVKQGWRSRALVAPRAVQVGDRFVLPEGRTLSVVHVDGRVETVTGPADLRFSSAPERPLGFLAGSLADAGKSVTSPAQPLDQPIRVTAPVGLTRFLKPTISWAARPNTLYDVAIVDPADPAAPPRLLKSTTPPVAFDALEAPLKSALPPDRILMILVRESALQDRVGVSRFLTAPDASTDDLPDAPHDLVAEIVSGLRKPPRRTGDAWLAWQKLPAAWRDSELGRRLQALLAAELGLPDPDADSQESPAPAPTPG